MAILDKFCPKCMNVIHKKDTKCSKCGMLVSDMKKEKTKKIDDKIKTEKEQIKQLEEIKEEPKEEVNKEPKVVLTEDGGAIVDTSTVFASKEKTEGKEAEDAKSNEQIEVSEESVAFVEFEEKKQPKRHKHKRKIKKDDVPNYTIDEDGSYNIDTSDVTYLEKATPSIKKARGDYEPEKIEWWEIYKWADRMLARRKIKKEVNKAATKIPEKINKGAMTAWCVFFGWLGIHNFYGGNKKKGWMIVAFDVIVLLIMNISVLFKIMGIFVGGGLGFAVIALWFTDLFGIMFNKYRYRISKEEFISNLNVETRAKLGKKWVALDKTVFKEKEEKRLNKKAKRKIRKLEKQKNKIEKDKKEKPKKRKQETDYEIIEHKMD